MGAIVDCGRGGRDISDREAATRAPSRFAGGCLPANRTLCRRIHFHRMGFPASLEQLLSTTAHSPFLSDLNNPYPRLPIHVSRVGALMGAVAAPIGRARKDKSAPSTPDAI